MRKALIVANHHRESACKLCCILIDKLHNHGVQAVVEENTAKRLDIGKEAAGDAAEADTAIAIGGDGTLLRTAHLAAPHGIPMLGINMGRLGFLSEPFPENLDVVIDRLIKKDYAIEERSMLKANVKGKVSGEIALNEMALTRGMQAGLTNVLVRVDGSVAGHYMGDGIMVATQTGSTAYSLSAGGPVVSPGVNCFIITPICPHTLSARPLVVPDSAKVSIHIYEGYGDVLLSADGQVNYTLDVYDDIYIEKNADSARFIRLDDMDFYVQMRNKLSEWNRPGFTYSEERMKP